MFRIPEISWDAKMGTKSYPECSGLQSGRSPNDRSPAPYLRRAGQEREVLTDGRGAVRVDWTRDKARRDGVWVDVPALGGGFALDHRPAR